MKALKKYTSLFADANECISIMMPLSLHKKQFMQPGADSIIIKCCLLNHGDFDGRRCHVWFHRKQKLLKSD